VSQLFALFPLTNRSSGCIEQNQGRGTGDGSRDFEQCLGARAIDSRMSLLIIHGDQAITYGVIFMILAYVVAPASALWLLARWLLKRRDCGKRN
jgi:UDP-2,3-diacylglucosamine pyrophosphatase LpxH